MARRVVIMVVLALVGVWLFAPTNSSHPAFACSPTEPLPATASPSPPPNVTPPPPTTTSAPVPTATFTTGQAIRATSLQSVIVVVGIIREINVSQVVLEVERYRRTSFLPATVTITTYRERAERQEIGCSLEWVWHKDRYPVLPLADRDKRAVFFLDTYRDGAGEVLVGRESTILLIDGDLLRDSETGASLGPVSQLDTLMVMETRPTDRPAPAPPVESSQPPAVRPPVVRERWPLGLLIAAGLALFGAALIALGLILRRIKPSKT